MKLFLGLSIINEAHTHSHYYRSDGIEIPIAGADALHAIAWNGGVDDQR